MLAAPSKRPKCDIVFSIQESTCEDSRISTALARIVGSVKDLDVNEGSISFRVCFKASSQQSARESLAPRAKRAFAVAGPMPEAEPVIEMTLLASEIIVLLKSWRRSLQ